MKFDGESTRKRHCRQNEQQGYSYGDRNPLCIENLFGWHIKSKEVVGDNVETLFFKPTLGFLICKMGIKIIVPTSWSYMSWYMWVSWCQTHKKHLINGSNCFCVVNFYKYSTEFERKHILCLYGIVINLYQLD